LHFYRAKEWFLHGSKNYITRWDWHELGYLNLAWSIRIPPWWREAHANKTGRFKQLTPEPENFYQVKTALGQGGQPVVYNHPYCLNADAFKDQIFFLAGQGYRCIAADRRGHGRSSQPWQGNDMDTDAEDLAELMESLDLKDGVLVGHSTGGVVALYIGRHGTNRVAKVVIIGSVTPSLLNTSENPGGTPLEIFDGFRKRSLPTGPNS